MGRLACGFQGLGLRVYGLGHFAKLKTPAVTAKEHAAPLLP